MLISRMQFRFGWFNWTEVHGTEEGEPYEVFLAVDEYLIGAKFEFGWIVDRISFISNYAEYDWWNRAMNSQVLGDELAFLEGKTLVYHGKLRLADITVYETQCYN